LPRAYNLLVATAARRSACLLADSAWTKRDTVQLLGLPTECVRVVHLAAGDECLPVSDRSRLQGARERYELADKYILYLGGFDRRKGVDTLLRAYARLCAPGLEVPPLVLAGRVPQWSTTALLDPRPLISSFGLGKTVRLTGAVPEEDKPLLYTGATLFVYPSTYEGFGLPPLEAMACGVPVVTTRAASLPEVCGDAALLVRPGDVEELASAMERVLCSPSLREELSGRGQLRVARFSWRETALKTAGVYREVAKGCPPKH